MNIREHIVTSVNRNPEKIYLYFEDQEISYREFNNNINRVANGLLRLRIRKGDRVAIMLQNCPEFFYSWLGLNKIGGVMVPINTAFKGEETKYILNHSEARIIIIANSLLDVLEGIKKDCGYLEKVICIGEGIIPDAISFSELIEGASAELPPLELGDEDLASIIYTSGTTGKPKGVMHTQRAYILVGQGFTLRVGARSEDRFFTPLPLFHANAQFYSTMGSLAAGASLILVERFSATKFWDQIRHFHATEFNFIGGMIRMLYNQPESPKDVDNPIRVAYGAPVPKDIFEAFEKRFGLTLVEGYGLTECPGASQNPLQVPRKIGSIGLPATHPDPSLRFMEMKIFDENDEELPPGNIGEIALKSPALMKGYFKDPEKTAEAIRKGWFHTGDYGFMDEDGYFYFVDRKKDIIRRRGENISSKEVEDVLNMHPKVLESAVIPVPSELGEDDVKACVILKPGEELPAEELISWCKERLAYFKVPRFIEYRQSLPKTPTGRIEKYLLK